MDEKDEPNYRYGFPYPTLPLRLFLLPSVVAFVLTFAWLMFQIEAGLLTSIALALINGALSNLPFILYAARGKKKRERMKRETQRDDGARS